MKSIKQLATILMLAVLLTLLMVSCNKDSATEPSTSTTVNVSTSDEFAVKRMTLSYTVVIDSTFKDDMKYVSADSVVVWKSNGAYYGRYLKNDTWFILDNKLTSFKR